MIEAACYISFDMWGGWKKPTDDSEDPKIYKKKEDDHYADKGNHKERTLGNEKDRSGGHKDHWKKEKKKKKDDDEGT